MPGHWNENYETVTPNKLGWAPGKDVVELDGVTQTRLDIA